MVIDCATTRFGEGGGGKGRENWEPPCISTGIALGISIAVGFWCWRGLRSQMYGKESLSMACDVAGAKVPRCWEGSR